MRHACHEAKRQKTMIRRPNLVRLASKRQMRRGATLVEMAFALPVLLLIVLGLFEFAFVFLVQHLLQDAAREGCRSAALPGSTNIEVQESVASSLQAYGISGITTRILVNNVQADLSGATSGDQVGVQISIPVANISVIPTGYVRGNLSANYSRVRE